MAPWNMNLPVNLAIEWAALSLAFALVAFRAGVRFWQRLFNAVDAVVVTSWILMFAGVALDTALYLMEYRTDQESLDSDPAYMEKILIVGYVDIPVQYLSFWGIKTALLIFYYSLFPPMMQKLRWCLHATVFFVATTFIISQLLNYFWCLPVSRNWDAFDPDNLCMAGVSDVPYYTTIAMHMFTDVLLYMLPFPLLRTLHLELRKKVGIAVMFSLGFISVGCTVARCIVSVRGGSISIIGMLGAVEQMTGLMVLCVPAFRLFFNSIERRRKTRATSRSAPPTPEKPRLALGKWGGWGGRSVDVEDSKGTILSTDEQSKQEMATQVSHVDWLDLSKSQSSSSMSAPRRSASPIKGLQPHPAVRPILRTEEAQRMEIERNVVHAYDINSATTSSSMFSSQVSSMP